VKAGVDPRTMNIKVDDGALDPYDPSPTNRAITDSELLAVLCGGNGEDVTKLKKLAFGGILNTKNNAK